MICVWFVCTAAHAKIKAKGENIFSFSLAYSITKKAFLKIFFFYQEELAKKKKKSQSPDFVYLEKLFCTLPTLRFL